jgi:Ca2+/Na+ antiporter
MKIRILFYILIFFLILYILSLFKNNISAKIEINKYDILSISHMENTKKAIFKIGNDGKNYILYTKNNDGGIVLEKYNIKLTTLYNTLSETETPYVKVESKKYKSGYYNIKKIDIFIQNNFAIENYENSQSNSEKSVKDSENSQSNTIKPEQDSENNSLHFLLFILIFVLIMKMFKR